MHKRWGDLPLRIVSALALVALVLFSLLYHHDSFIMLLLMAGYVLGREWQRLNIENNIIFAITGFLYVVVSVFSLYWLRSTPLPYADSVRLGLDYLWLLFAIVWGTDIGAYFVGRFLGGKKLWPSVSPNKTWSGAVGGALFALAAAYGVTVYTGLPVAIELVLAMALIASAISQLGDLFESHLKRRAGVKDSGNIIPGHGGLFDRVDGLMAAAPVFACMVALL